MYQPAIPIIVRYGHYWSGIQPGDEDNVFAALTPGSRPGFLMLQCPLVHLSSALTVVLTFSALSAKSSGPPSHSPREGSNISPSISRRSIGSIYVFNPHCNYDQSRLLCRSLHRDIHDNHDDLQSPIQQRWPQCAGHDQKCDSVTFFSSISVTNPSLRSRVGLVSKIMITCAYSATYQLPTAFIRGDSLAGPFCEQRFVCMELFCWS
jgi:hypothetical protein